MAQENNSKTLGYIGSLKESSNKVLCKVTYA